MDQHPIPQNVTGFQFKLIGSMTVKQFGYLAVGVVGAVITYYLPLGGLFGILLKIILIPLFGASGAIIAFVPIDGRPIDVMASNFMRALFSPNQYVYRKGDRKFSFSKTSLHKSTPRPAGSKRPYESPNKKIASDKSHELQKILLKDSMQKIKNPQDAREAEFLKTFLSLPANQAPAAQFIQTPSVSSIQPASQHAPTPSPLPPAPKTENEEQAKVATINNSESVLSQKEEALKKQLDFAKQEEKTTTKPEELESIHQKAVSLEKQVEEIHAQKQLLEQEILNLKNQLSEQRAAVAGIAKVPKSTVPQTNISSHVRSIPQELNKKMGLLVSDTPNVVAGTVKDARGNVLPNILVEIKDKSGNPVRAFKTNTLGNFASATPLAPGTYTITLEDLKKQHTFDSIQITATNQIMLPIEIISYDKREALRKELFN